MDLDINTITSGLRDIDKRNAKRAVKGRNRNKVPYVVYSFNFNHKIYYIYFEIPKYFNKKNKINNLVLNKYNKNANI